MALPRTALVSSRPRARLGWVLLGLWLAGCSELILLGSECPGTRGPCPREDAGRAPDAEEDAQAEMDADGPGDSDADVDADAGSEPDAGSDEDAALDASADGCALVSDADACGCEVLAPDLVVAHWPLDERSGQTAADATGRGATGALQNFSGGAPWASGKIDFALQFDGVDDQVSVGPVGGEVRTLALWLKPEGAPVLTHRTPMQLPTSHGPLDQWNDPENAYLDDGKWATAASLIGTKDQLWGGFHLTRNLPPGAVIKGITVTIDTGNLGVLGAFAVELSWDGGVSHTDSRYAWGQLIIGSNLRQAGGGDKLWGRTWTAEAFSDANFRVRAAFGGIANAMSLDFLGVELEYAAQATPRAVLALSPEMRVELAGADSNVPTVSGWPESSIYVNGSGSGALVDGWNHLVIVGAALSPTDVLLGNAGVVEHLSLPYRGLMDDVQLLRAALTPQQIAQLYAQSSCAP